MTFLEKSLPLLLLNVSTRVGCNNIHPIVFAPGFCLLISHAMASPESLFSESVFPAFDDL